MNYFVAFFLLSTFIFCSVVYIVVGIKLRMHASNLSANNPQNIQKYNRTAKVMMMYMLAYFAQYAFAIVFNIWSLFAMPPIAMVILIVVFSNMGGFFNFVAYTWARKRYLNVVEPSVNP